MFFARSRKIKKIFYTGLIVAVVFLSWSIVHTETQSGNINVNMTVPTPPGETPGPGTSYNNPIIFNVTTTANFYQAVITWEVDFKYEGSGNTTSIYYGKGDYASTTVVTASGTKFSAVLENLESDTVYTFKISATNGAALTSEHYGNLKTEKAKILKTLTILAKPEKRDLSFGPNYSANASLIFLNQTASEIKQIINLLLDASGTTTISNIEVPEGTTMVAVLKTDAHLAKRLNGVNTADDTLVLDFTINNTAYLLAGDMAGDISAVGSQNIFTQFLQGARQDDFVDILDISTVVSKFNNQQSGERTNLNADRIVDAQDISMVLSNWNKTGDIIMK